LLIKKQKSRGRPPKQNITKYAELKIIISRAGKLLNKSLTPLFSFVDATKFSSWKIKETEFHVYNIVAQETVYPVGISFLTNTVRDSVNECVPKGSGKLLADAWYDVNKALQVMFEKGYIPLVCPNKGRGEGYYRRQARKLYRKNRGIYRQRTRGESMFGSLTNEFGDRLKAINKKSMQVRIMARVISYQIKLLIRCDEEIVSIDV
jgi:hypothetical protein